MFILKPVQPLHLPAAIELRPGSLYQFQKISQMTGADYFAFAALRQFLTRVLANGLKQIVTRFAVLLAIHRHKRFIHEVNEQIQSILILTNGFRCFERPSACEYREPLECPSFFVREQVIAPVDRSSQGLLARQGGAAAPVSSRNESSRRFAI